MNRMRKVDSGKLQDVVAWLESVRDRDNGMPESEWAGQALELLEILRVQRGPHPLPARHETQAQLHPRYDSGEVSMDVPEEVQRPNLDADIRECGCADGEACLECTDPSDWEMPS